MVDRTNIIEKTVSNTAIDASKVLDRKNAEIETARQYLKNQIAQSGLSSLEQGRLLDEVERALDGASKSLVPINMSQFIAGLTARIKQEIAEEKAAEDKMQATRAIYASAYEAIQLSAAAQARIAKACQDFNPHSYDSVHRYASGLVGNSGYPEVDKYEAEALADYMMNNPDGKEAAKILANTPAEEKKKIFENHERDKIILDKLEADSSLSREDKKFFYKIEHQKLYAKKEVHDLLEKYHNGEISVEQLKTGIQPYEEAFLQNRRNNRHHETKKEQQIQAMGASCGKDTCSASEYLGIWEQIESNPEQMKKAKALYESILKNGSSAVESMEQSDYDMAMAYMKNMPDTYKQYVKNTAENVIKNKVPEVAKDYTKYYEALSESERQETISRVGAITEKSFASDEKYLKKLSTSSDPVMSAMGEYYSAKKDDHAARVAALTKMVETDKVVVSYGKKYGAADTQKAVTKLDETGAFDGLFGAGTAAKSAVDIATNILNTNKEETDKISHTTGLGVKNRLKKMGVSEETAQEWGHKTTEVLKAGADVKNAVIAAAVETKNELAQQATELKNQAAQATDNVWDSVSAKFGHNTLGNQIDKNLAAINKNATFVAVSDGNGHKIFNTDGKGGISKEELLKVFEKHGITDLKQIDKNGDGVSQGELTAAMNKIMQQERAAGKAKKIEEVAGKYIDKDFAQDLKNAKITFSKDEIKLLDANGDNKIDLKDKDKIIELMKKKGIDLNSFDKDHNGIDIKELSEAMHKAAETPNAPKKQSQPAKSH